MSDSRFRVTTLMNTFVRGPGEWGTQSMALEHVDKPRAYRQIRLRCGVIERAFSPLFLYGAVDLGHRPRLV